MNATASHPARSRSDIPHTGSWGVVLAFRHRTQAEVMTQAGSSVGGFDHAALILAIAHDRDRAAFAELFGYFGPRVKAWMLRAGSNPTRAEELAQETMLAVWQKARLFDPARAGASTWIFTIARNLRIDALRRERHPSELMPDPAEEPDAPMQADRVLALSQQEVRIRSALSLLPPEQAEVIRKAFFEDKVHAEIEKELGIPLGTVKSRLRLAMNRLRAVLGDLA
jgi:RNA polymerase sigma-70 factor (ECF subfamily)